MRIRKFVIALIACFILSNLLTTVWYMFSDVANVVSFRRSEVNYLGLVANHIIFSLGFVYLFQFYVAMKKGLLNGFIYGVILAGMMFIPTGIVVRSIWQVDFNLIFILNTIAHLLIGGMMGITVWVIFNKKTK